MQLRFAGSRHNCMNGLWPGARGAEHQATIPRAISVATVAVNCYGRLCHEKSLTLLGHRIRTSHNIVLKTKPLHNAPHRLGLLRKGLGH